MRGGPEAACVLELLERETRFGNSRLNPNSNKRQIVVSNVTKYLLKRKLIM